MKKFIFNSPLITCSFGCLHLVMLLGFLSCESPMKSEWTLTHNAQGVAFKLMLTDAGELYYQVLTGGDILIDSSRLGIVRSDADLSTGLAFQSASEKQPIDEEHSFLTGKALVSKEEGVSQSFVFANPEGVELEVACKVYENGLALRYVFPGKTDQSVTVRRDLMQYHIAPDAEAWLQPYDQISKWTPAYERYYEKGVSPGGVSLFGNGWAFPALFRSGEQWLLLSESGSDFAGSHLDNPEGSSTYYLRWPEPGEAMGRGESQPSGRLPWQTTWKTFAIGDLGAIVSSDLVRHVAPPQKVDDTSWIKPGRVSWSWLSDHDSPQDKEKLKSFIDLAEDMGWEYSLVDANWNLMPDGTIEELVAYAKERNVGLLLWYNSGGPHNEVTEQPRDRMHLRERRREEFAWMQEVGVKGIKIDFFQSDKQSILQQYIDILEDAADYKLLINFHGCAIPRGWSRTYPQLMTMESVRGAESYTFDGSFPENAPSLNTILPFTRNVIGSMDYTPLVTTDMQFPHITTNAHELALSALFESGWQHLADAVEGFRKLPEEATLLLRELPTTWDETQYVSGYPGQDVVVARRKGDVWYVAGVNGENRAKSWEVDLSFVDTSMSMVAVYDGEDPRQLQTTSELWEGSPWPVALLPYGGFIMRLVPVDR